jgi:hypothetical protein
MTLFHPDEGLSLICVRLADRALCAFPDITKAQSGAAVIVRMKVSCGLRETEMNLTSLNARAAASIPR